MKHIVIIGASSGIGLALAESFALRGYKVGLGARRTEPMTELKSRYPERVEVARIDVNSPDAPGALLALAERLGGMDVYLHAAGIGYDNPPLDSEREADIIDTNAAGFARMVSAAFRYFRDSRQGRGQIAAITSVAGTNGIGEMAAYSASKRCAQTYLTALRQLAHTQKADIVITDIRPGWIKTPLLYDGRRYPLEMTLDRAVPLIVRAIERRKRVAVIGWRWKIVTALWRCIPDVVWTRLNLPVAGSE